MPGRSPSLCSASGWCCGATATAATPRWRIAAAIVAALSKGWVDGNSIVCPYHGWAYDGDGACVKIPQRPDSAGLKGSVVKSFFCEVRYGHVWVALEEPLAPITGSEEMIPVSPPSTSSTSRGPARRSG